MEKLKYERYKINQKLYDYAVADLPEGCSKLEEARHIYNRLCKKLEYSLEYFIDDTTNMSQNSKVKRRLSDIGYIETVDGEENKEVVCFLFSAIYTYILYDRDLISAEDMYDNVHIIKGNFDLAHYPIYCTIDGVRLVIDASNGLDMDLSISKFGYNQLRGWKCGYTNTDEALEKFEKLLLKEKFEMMKKESLEKAYRALKAKNETLATLSLEERASLFFEGIKESPNYSFESVSYISNLYKNLFSCVDTVDGKRYADLSFGLEDGELKEFFFLNAKGYQNFIGAENFPYLKIYEISLKDKTFKEVDRQELLDKIYFKQLTILTSSGARHSASDMMKKATIAMPTGGKNGK